MKSSVAELTVCPAFVMLLKCIGLTTTQVEAEAEVYSGPVKNIENKALSSNRETWCESCGRQWCKDNSICPTFKIMRR